MIHSDKFFIGHSEFAGASGLWCRMCLECAGTHPALLHEWFNGEARTLDDLISRAEAHWHQVHEVHEPVESRLLVHRYVSVDPEMSHNPEQE